MSFKYPKTDRMILDHVNITIKRGETLSIVGVNGAGKTTFVKLLCRFYEPTEGEIFVNGIPVKDIPLNEYYGLLGVVFQDFSLFNFTVRENISMSTKADEDRLRDAIVKCGLENRVETLPDGVDTYIYKEFDPDGIELSGGEGQKIAIARAVYRGAQSSSSMSRRPRSTLSRSTTSTVISTILRKTARRYIIHIGCRLRASPTARRFSPTAPSPNTARMMS